MPELEIKGECFGVRLEDGPEGSSGTWCTLLVEDDENWFDKGEGPFDAAWIQDIIDVLLVAKTAIAQENKND
jgi:hypothetical protein